MQLTWGKLNCYGIFIGSLVNLTLTLKQLGIFFFQNVISFSNVVHYKCDI